jgi:hypothetical protein
MTYFTLSYNILSFKNEINIAKVKYERLLSLTVFAYIVYEIKNDILYSMKSCEIAYLAFACLAKIGSVSITDLLIIVDL